MSDKKPVIVYGVSGYTGRLVCEYLREYNIPFIAAGRDKKKVQDVVDKIPGIETADCEVVGVEHSRSALAELFRGAKVVSKPTLRVKGGPPRGGEAERDGKNLHGIWIRDRSGRRRRAPGVERG